jgi:hypothetical protein
MRTKQELQARYNILFNKERTQQQQQQFQQLKNVLEQNQEDSLFDDLQQDLQQGQQAPFDSQELGSELEFTYDCLSKKESILVHIFALDSIQEIKLRIMEASGNFSNYIFFKETFLQTHCILDLYRVFLEIPKPKPKPIRRPSMGKKPVVAKPVVDEPVALGGQERNPLLNIYNCCKSYGIKLFNFLKLYVVFQMIQNFPFLLKQTLSADEKRVLDTLEPQIKLIIDSLPELSLFKDRCIDDNKTRVGKKEMKSEWTLEWLQTEIKNMLNKKDSNLQAIEAWTQLAMRYESLTILPIRDESIVGQVESFKVSTEDTTGILFNKLNLSIDYPIAKYTKFYKIYLVENGFTKTQNEEITLDNTEALRILDKEGRLCFYIENQPKGLQIQCVLETESVISDRLLLIQFLKLEPQRVQASVSMGIVAEFYMDMETKIPFDPSIFSNLCMNHPLFSKFLKINDTDKISRGKSVFLYFTNYGKRHEKASQEIHVGGWNKIVSRFGDLTAILSPIQKKEKKCVVYVKVIRSATIEMVRMFQNSLGKLVHLYEELFQEQVALFTKYNPRFEPYIAPVEKEISTSGVKNLSNKIFYGGFSRSCQFPKGPVILSDAIATTKDNKHKLLFPPTRHKEFIPQWYGCNVPEYPYPGLITLNKVGHPFGYAPCCYKENHENDNLEVTKEIEFFIQHGYYEYFDKQVNFNTEKKGTRLHTIYKIANFIGQEGPLPEKLEQFMNLLEPSLKFNKVGTNRWKYDSLLGCLEYRKAKLQETPFMKSPRELRTELLTFTLEVGMQQNYDIGVEGIRHILQDPNTTIEANRFIRILEEFYNVNIFIFTQSIDRKIDILRPKNYKEYYYTFWNVIKRRPIVFLVEYSELFKYELIMARDDSGSIDYDLDCYPEYRKLLLHTYGSFSGQLPIVIPNDCAMKDLFTHQIFDCYGKTRIFLIQDKFPVLLSKPIAPFNLPTFIGELPMPKYSVIKEYLDSKGIDIIQTYHYKQNLVLVVRDFTLLFFICSSQGQQQQLRGLDIPSIAKTQDTEILEIVHLLKNNGTNLIMTKDNIRLVNAIKDLCLFYFSQFMKDLLPKITLYNIGDSIRQFFENMVEFKPIEQLDYRSIEQIHPRISNNTHIFHGEKLHLPQILERKLFFFLQWFSVTKTTLFHQYRNIIEIPSYFDYSSDFIYKTDHIIQTSLLPFQNSSSQSYCHLPLDSVTKPLQTLFFYYHPKETKENKPYLAYITTDLRFGCRIATYFYLHKSISMPSDFVTIASHYQRTIIENKWVKKGPGTARFLVYHGKEVYVFLMNFSSKVCF